MGRSLGNSNLSLRIVLIFYNRWLITEWFPRVISLGPYSNMQLDVFWMAIARAVVNSNFVDEMKQLDGLHCWIGQEVFRLHPWVLGQEVLKCEANMKNQTS